MSEPDFNPVLRGPVTQVEPNFLDAMPKDNIVGALVALTAEVYMLRERLATLESELAARRVLPEGAVEEHVDTPAEQQTRAADVAAFTNRVLSELARGREPVSRIDPAVTRYLKTHAELIAEQIKR